MKKIKLLKFSKKIEWKSVPTTAERLDKIKNEKEITKNDIINVMENEVKDLKSELKRARMIANKLNSINNRLKNRININNGFYDALTKHEDKIK